MDYADFMKDAARIFNERNPRYGDMRIGMDRVATMATIMTGIHLTAHDVALVLHAVKLSRLGGDRANPDHYVDGINYLAFAGELIQPDEIPQPDGASQVQTDIEDGMSKITSMFANANHG